MTIRPGPSHQGFEQSEFGTGQTQPLAAAHRLVCRGIELQIGNDERRRTLGRSAARQRPNAREEHVERERLRQIVVSADIQSADDIGRFVPRGQQQNRRGVPLLPKSPHDLEAVHFRQHHIEHQHVEMIALGDRKAVSAVDRHDGLLHLGRAYFEQISRRLTLRVAADLWWIAYLTIRDGSLLASVLLGFLTLNLDLMADIKIGLPFVPLATPTLAAALVVKTFYTMGDDRSPDRAAMSLVLIGALLNMLGYVLVMEAPGDEYAVSHSLFWQTLVGWRSNTNRPLAVVSFSIAIAALAALAVWVCVLSLRQSHSSPEDQSNVAA